MTHWSPRYIGIPSAPLGRDFSGADCWGLAVLVYAGMGIELPSYAGDYLNAAEQAEIGALIAGAKIGNVWRRVEGTPQETDLCTFRRAGLDTHIGIVVADGLMLHMPSNSHSRIESYASGYWAPRLTGIWRHEAFP